MSDGGGAYIEAWLSRERVRRETGESSLIEADRMRREEGAEELKARKFLLILALAVVALHIIIP